MRMSMIRGFNRATNRESNRERLMERPNRKQTWPYLTGRIKSSQARHCPACYKGARTEEQNRMPFLDDSSSSNDVLACKIKLKLLFFNFSIVLELVFELLLELLS